MTQKQRAQFWVQEYMHQVIPGLYGILQGHFDEQYRKYIIDQLSTPMPTEYRNAVRIKYIMSCMEYWIHKTLQCRTDEEHDQNLQVEKDLKEILYIAIARW